MADSKNFNETIGSLFKGMDSLVSAKTVVGNAVNVNGTILIPLVDVSFGVGAGVSDNEKNGTGTKNGAAGGLGGKVTPNAILVIKDDQIKLVNVKNQDAFSKIIDMVPDVINKFTGKNADITEEPEVKENIERLKK